MAFGGGGPHFCLGANLARMEIRVMFEHLLDRLPDLRLDGEVQRLQSAFINGVKHLPVAFSPARTGRALTSRRRRRTTRDGSSVRALPPGGDVPAHPHAARPGQAADDQGYDGIYVSDHMFFPRDRQSPLHVLDRRGRRAGFGDHWEPETEWPDPGASSRPWRR